MRWESSWNEVGTIVEMRWERSSWNEVGTIVEMRWERSTFMSTGAASLGALEGDVK